MMRALRSFCRRIYNFRPRLDSADLSVLMPIFALVNIVIGVALVYLPAAWIVGGAGYLILGAYRRWY